MLQVERAHLQKTRKQSMQRGNNFIFTNLKQQDVCAVRSETEHSIIKACAEMAPNRQYAERFTGLLKQELSWQTDEQLVQMLDLV